MLEHIKQFVKLELYSQTNLKSISQNKNVFICQQCKTHIRLIIKDCQMSNQENVTYKEKSIKNSSGLHR